MHFLIKRKNITLLVSITIISNTYTRGLVLPYSLLVGFVWLRRWSFHPTCLCPGQRSLWTAWIVWFQVSQIVFAEISRFKMWILILICYEMILLSGEKNKLAYNAISKFWHCISIIIFLKMYMDRLRRHMGNLAPYFDCNSENSIKN